MTTCMDVYFHRKNNNSARCDSNSTQKMCEWILIRTVCRGRENSTGCTPGASHTKFRDDEGVRTSFSSYVILRVLIDNHFVGRFCLAHSILLCQTFSHGMSDSPNWNQIRHISDQESLLSSLFFSPPPSSTSNYNFKHFLATAKLILVPSQL